MPQYKMRVWDGYIRLFNMMNCQLYIGLLPYLEKFCEERTYHLEIDPLLFPEKSYSEEDISKFLDSLKLPFEARDYQINAVKHALSNERSVLLSPTGSGKSLIIYSLIRWYKKRTLIIVPTISLVQQMISDFADYAKNDNFDVTKKCAGIFDGKNRETKKEIVVSTWQSIYKLPKTWFEQFEVVIGDEAHLYKASSLKSILEKMINAKYRIGTTGTLDGTQTHKLVLEGLFGPVFNVTTTKKLMDQEHLAKLEIHCLIIKHPEERAKAMKDFKYHDELAYILANKKRNSFITNLSLNLKQNTMILFQHIEHGKLLFNMISEKLKQNDSKRKIFYVSGETEANDREKVRKITETEDNAIIVASVGVFSTGINIKNLENIVFASPSKSRIRTLQSIGRVLRVGRSDKATLYDIVDDLSHKSHKNFALKHFIERVKIYDAEKFDYKLSKIDFTKKLS